MRIFKLNREYSIACESKSTRNGFKHEATLTRNGYSIAFNKACYLNRTWEAYEYQTVMQGLISASDLSKNLLTRFKKRIDTQNFAK